MMNRLRTLTVFLFLPLALYARQAMPAATNRATTAAVAIVTPKMPEEFFDRARQLSDLIAAGIPFHLKATYVATGDADFFTGNGTFEEWWKSKDTWRKEVTLGNYKYVLIKNNGKFARYDTSAYIPLRLQQVVQSLPVPFPSLAVASGYWETQHQKLNKIDLTVLIQEAPPIGNKATSDRDPKYDLRYYFDPGGLLRIRIKDATVALYNDFQAFQNLVVPRKIEVSAGSDPFLTIAVDLLEPLGTDAKVLSKLEEVPGDLQLIPPRPHAEAGVTPSRLIHSPPPAYPDAARRQRIEGTVVISATIDENGVTREPHVIRSAGPLLDTAALQAVRQWRYQPTIFNGSPMAVDITISIVFSLKQ